MFSIIAVLIIQCLCLSSAGVLPNDGVLPSDGALDLKRQESRERQESRIGDETEWLDKELDATRSKDFIETFHTNSLEPTSKVFRLKQLLMLNTLHSSFDLPFNDLKCLGCQVGINFLKDYMEHGASQTEVGLMVVKLCRMFRIQKPDVCQGVVDQYKDEVLYVISHLNKQTASADYICGVLLETRCNGEPGSKPEWNVTFPDVPKPPVTPLKPPKPGLPKLRVLHLSDIHVDFLYKPGSNAECDKPLCCHDGEPKGEPAGKWGDYRNCDTPTWTLEHLFQDLCQGPQFDYILWTGDLTSHMVWNQSQSEHLRDLEYLTQLFQTFFPKTPVYSSVGNHESVPVNSFPPPLFEKLNKSIAWLYKGLYRSWRNWLPADTEDTILRGGFYTTLIRPGFRMISLNDNFCSSGNWWLFLNSSDPANQLSWLVNVLQKAETNNEKVHILGHIPPGSSECLRTWSWNYYRIVNRYEGVIAGQFFGHKHYDSLEIFYDISDFKRPVSVAYAAPSVTTYSLLNPGYRVYEFDGFYPNSSWMVLDHETFIMNLTEANLRDEEPIWSKEYSAKSAYNMPSLTPDSWNSLSTKLLTDDKLFQKYLRFYYKSSDAAPTCDTTCRKRLVCELRSGLSHDLRPCPHLLQGSMESENQLAATYSKWLEEKRVC